MNRIFTTLPAVAVAGVFALACSDTTTGPEQLTPDRASLFEPASLTTVYWEGHGSDHLPCDGGYHWILAPGGGSTAIPLFVSSETPGGAEMFRMSGNAGDNAAWHYNSGLVDLEEGVTPHVLFAGTPHGSVKLTISHCLEAEDVEHLTVSKTVVTYFERTHDWSIDKSVTTDNEFMLDGFPKIWLYTDGSGDEDATWTVDVTYQGFLDGDYNVSGEIFIANTGDLAAEILSVVDVLGGTTIDIDCGVTFPYTLAVGDELTCTYDEDGEFEGDNVVTVTTEVDSYDTTEEIVWSDPDVEHHRYATITDTNAGFALKYDPSDEGVVLDAHDYDEGDTETFEYSDSFAYADYEDCDGERIDNTAEVRGDEGALLDDAEATLLVNVQCINWESAWAIGGDGATANPFCDNGFSNWGWSNQIGQPYQGEWAVYAGAGQCLTSKGTHVGTFAVTYGADGSFDYAFNITDGFPTEGEAVYAGSAMFPKTKNNKDTTAPGQYSIATNLSGDIYVIAHINVGIPDPDFGPTE